MLLVPPPAAESLAHRARIAALLAPLRPTQFRAPLTRLEAHRIPTLWTLYRGILRDAPDEMVRLSCYNSVPGTEEDAMDPVRTTECNTD